MKLRSIYLVVVVALAMALAACGGSEGDDGGGDTQATSGGAGGDEGTTAPGGDGTMAPGDDGGDDDGGEPAGPVEVTEMGSFTVNGTEFAVNLLNRCIPFGGEDGETIDLQPIAQGQGAGLNLYGSGGEFDEVSVQGTAIEELLGTNSYGSDFETPIESVISGDRWTGSATIFDSYGSGDSAELTWDVMIPDEVNDCSL